MKKLLALLLALALVPCLALAEDVLVEEYTIAPLPIDFTPGHVADPANFTDSGYEDETITVQMERVWVEDTHFNVARVKISDPSQLRTTLANPKNTNKTNRISTIAKDNNAVVAIGGDFFTKDSYGYVVRMQEVYRKKPLKSRDMLITDENGDFHIIKNSDAAQLQALMESHTLVNVFNFGPALVIGGEKQEIDKDYKYNPNGFEPRCAIGQVGPLEYLLVVADGGKGRELKITNADGSVKKSHGCNMEMLAQFMADQGCLEAYNLDGGNSALMVFGEENYSKKSVSSERAVSDIIYFATAIDFGLDAED